MLIKRASANGFRDAENEIVEKLDQVIQRVRHETVRSFRSSSNGPYNLTSDEARGGCGACTHRLVQEAAGVGIRIIPHQAQRLFKVGQHVFGVVPLSRGRAFYVDITFQQFNSGEMQFLMRHPRGRLFLTHLLKKGYAEVDGEMLSLVAKALAVGSPPNLSVRRITIPELVNPTWDFTN